MNSQTSTSPPEHQAKPEAIASAVGLTVQP